MRDIYNKLMKFADIMDVNSPVTEDMLLKTKEDIPQPLQELYRCFNGGEIFVPGTKIYGLTDNEQDIIFVNKSDVRKNFSIPESYLIFARLNFGDLICINKNNPFDVIQWDHETNEMFNRWGALENWLNETIEEYSA